MKPCTVLAMTILVAGCAHQPTQGATTVVLDSVKTAPAASAPVVLTPAARSEASRDDAAEFERVLKGATLYFDFNADRLTPENLGALQRVGQLLRTHPSLAIRIDGNTDERGTEEYNIALGQRRAAVAKNYLVALGAKASQIDTVSFGAERPAVPGHTEDAWAKNRRDDVLPASKP